VKGLTALPSDTVIDGEIVAIDESGLPSFNLLQGFGDAQAIVLYAFDLLMLHGKDVRQWLLNDRPEHLHKIVTSLPDTIPSSETFNRAASRIDEGCQKTRARSRIGARQGPSDRLA